MKIALIIPLYKQSQYWNKILESISKQTILPDNIYVVIDRPQDDNNCFEYIKHCNDKYSLNIHILSINNIPKNIQRKNDVIFLAGMARNIGLERAIYDGCDQFIFTDGDCILEKNLIASHINKLNKLYPVCSNGKRLEQSYKWRDRREVVPELTHLQLFHKKGTIINDTNLLKNCLVVWSCNLGLNLIAVNLIKKFNSIYYNRCELFNSDFLGAWGGEDSFLGICLYYCRIFIVTIGDNLSGVKHIDHPRPTSKYSIEHKTFFNDMCDKLRDKYRINQLRLDFFDNYSGSSVFS
jgi:hypothetical protein